MTEVSTVKAVSPLGSESRVHHIAIGVSDIEAGIRWYEEKLDCVCTERFGFPELDVQFAYLQAPGGYIFELIDKSGAEDHPYSFSGPPTAARMRGLVHVAFDVHDVDAAVVELKRRGVIVVKEPANSTKVPLRTAYFLDICGTLLELVGPVRPV